MLAQGNMTDIKADERVREAYLGGPRLAWPPDEPHRDREPACRLWRHGYPARHRHGGRGRRARRHHRPERCRQIDLDQGPFRHRRDPGRTRTFSGNEITGDAPERLVPSAWPMCRRSATSSRRLRWENLEMGAFSGAADRAVARDAIRAFSRARTAPGQLRRRDVGRAAADGRARPGPDDEAEATPAGRADRGLAPKIMAEVFERVQAINAGGDGHPHGRAERARCPGHRPSRLCAGPGRNRFADTAAALLANREWRRRSWAVARRR